MTTIKGDFGGPQESQQHNCFISFFKSIGARPSVHTSFTRGGDPIPVPHRGPPSRSPIEVGASVSQVGTTATIGR